jgi:hypothetical protein
MHWGLESPRQCAKGSKPGRFDAFTFDLSPFTLSLVPRTSHLLYAILFSYLSFGRAPS